MPIACFNSQQKLSLEDLHKIKADKIPGSADRQLVATVKITALWDVTSSTLLMSQWIVTHLWAYKQCEFHSMGN